MGPTYLTDTAAYSKYIQGLLRLESMTLMSLAVETQSVMSVITRMELLSWRTGSKLLDEDIKQFISQSVVHDLTEPIILQTIRIRRQHRVKLPDAIIAATAMVNNLTLLSTNDRDFETIPSLNYQSLN